MSCLGMPILYIQHVLYGAHAATPLLTGLSVRVFKYDRSICIRARAMDITRMNVIVYRGDQGMTCSLDSACSYRMAPSALTVHPALTTRHLP